MKEKIESIKSAALLAVEEADSSAALNDVRVRFLGKNGEMTSLMKLLGTVSKEERPAMGKALNDVRVEIESVLDAKIAAVSEREKQARLAAEAVDVTLPARTRRTGTLHPLTQVREDIIKVFLGMGFSVAEGPEIESDLFNFQLLNVPKDHPARDMQDTFYVNDNFVLRTHTSPMQARIMTTQQPPVRVVIPGRVYRSDDDASHSPIFHQIEGLAVDKHITMGDLEGCLQTFAEQLFDKDTKIRLRPSYFPFTEPSVEVDVTCAICHGKGCRVCKGTGWVEILGAGIVNPAVLDMCGIDSKEYSGFAFGMGIERIAMIKYGIPNIKLFYENDVRFLKQFN
ncbi:MAG: phenylalanine--tRNA ligase subunit alpha [Acutalibacteraceae bacterium]